MPTTRRAILTTASALGVTALAGSATAQAATGTARAATGTSHAESADGRFTALERRHGARLGVFAHDIRTGRTVRHRADERFPMCSTFKTIAVAAVLRDLDKDGKFLARRIHYTQADIDRADGAPETGKAENLANGMTVSELCGAAISYSDNTAANLLMEHLGGPTAVTRFCRSTGDRTTRLDRWEPELNSAEPGRVTDTTTPRAIGTTYAHLVLGGALAPADRDRLTRWLLANTTSAERFRKALPADWVLGDKTGTGSYGTANDVGIAWTPDGAPVVLSVLSTKPDKDAEGDSPLVARAAELIVESLGS
ncbi:class A beta-lactamase [Streptomyces sp. NBC_00006]|uniref:class A beta-lactamase n=1 Tax=Streptomyces sp. NBC_00006 TaxID=2975619 RepID=UPI002254C05D|nr:class A beta-lactamase [Streptomyces sp. NBC_00006]MCX5532835.1 class A beta-lactamase [Streptomyces sp. NBC_00006]